MWVCAGHPKHVIAIGKVLERADKEKGSDPASNASSDALQVARNRGILSAEEIAALVRPFK